MSGSTSYCCLAVPRVLAQTEVEVTELWQLAQDFQTLVTQLMGHFQGQVGEVGETRWMNARQQFRDR